MRKKKIFVSNLLIIVLLLSGCTHPPVSNQPKNENNEYCTYDFEGKQFNYKNECAKEYEVFSPIEDGNNRCCDGLKAIDKWFVPISCNPDLDKYKDENSCVNAGPFHPFRICTKCGDGFCEIPENRCNCPEDCLEGETEDKNCFKEGEGEAQAGQCCSGLERINACFEDKESGYLTDNGAICLCQYHLGPCTPCGNNKCEKNFGENKCSCPEDCN